METIGRVSFGFSVGFRVSGFRVYRVYGLGFLSDLAWGFVFPGLGFIGFYGI